MSIRLIEIKSEYLKEDEREFLFKVSATEQILHYPDLMISEEQVREYLKNNSIPKDKYFDIETFISDLDCESYMSINVEKEETANYIADMLGELI
ncbi:MAG: hypothetical protein WC781_05705 [Candidatus Pacearchaeota archaeon]|jgi:hypothetical protein